MGDRETLATSGDDAKMEPTGCQRRCPQANKRKTVSLHLGTEYEPQPVATDAVGVILPRKTHMYQLQLAAQGRRDRSRSVRSGVLPAPDRVLDVGLRESKAGRRACARESASPPSALFGAFLFLLKTYTPNCLCLAPVTGARQSGDRGDSIPRLGYIGVLPGQFFANPLQ